MSDDIVERLRSSARPEYATTIIVSDALLEAAAEIERLRAALQTIGDRATVHMGDYDIRICDEPLDEFIARALEPKP